MEITYLRKLHKSYMCIETTEDIVEEHELMILQKYKVPQLLPLQIMIQDGKVQYWFEITGKQQLTDYLMGKPIGKRELKKILFSMEQVCEKIPEFLLKEERICLLQELLYVDLADETVYFTYLPFWSGSFPEEFRRWMEETLKNIDHQDRACIELAYDVYEKSRQENVSMQEILIEVSRKEENIFPKTVERKMTEWGEEKALVQEKRGKVAKEKATEENETKEKWNRILKIQGDKCTDIIEAIWSEVKEYVMGKMPKKLLNYRKASKRKEIRKGASDILQSKDYHTGLLRKKPEKPEGKLIYQGEHGCTDFQIETEEYFLGRNSEEVDGKIETDGISRVHARIIKREGEYYIEDLNSTNGTYVNGELLERHRLRKLNVNDWVRFGIEEYLFC